MPRPLIPHRRERILDAAEALILDRGFDAMSVQAIAEQVGIAKGAIYREFASKHEILDVLLRRSMERMLTAGRVRLGDDPHPPLSLAYRVGAEVLLEDPLMTAAFLDDAGVLGSYIDSVTDGRYRQRYLATAEWITELQRQGRLSSGLDAEALALALSSATLGLLIASRHLGPLEPGRLRDALLAIETMVALLEPDPPLPPASASK
ncbi:MAG: TetR/AcrR family transcriptional regulator [Propionibacteriaceae bacterium]|nr:TetR/AcrR family transcriptional regulator [Propionibacteriaceae bacterium]